MKIPPVYAFQLTKNGPISSHWSLGLQGWRRQGRPRAEAGAGGAGAGLEASPGGGCAQSPPRGDLEWQSQERSQRLRRLAEHRGMNLVYKGGLYWGCARAGRRVDLVWPSGRMTSVTAYVQYHHVSKHAVDPASRSGHLLGHRSLQSGVSPKLLMPN